MLYSTAKETPASVPPNEGYDFTYDDYKDQFKTGDLIVYSGIGVMDALVQVRVSMPFSLTSGWNAFVLITFIHVWNR
jgi:hypothetical protein